MNKKGQDGALVAMLFALIGVIGIFIFMEMWSPIVGVLLPLFDNTETVLLGASAKVFVTMIPAMLVFVLVIGILLRIRGEQRPPVAFG